MGQDITSRISLMNTQPTFLLWPLFNLTPILSKGHKSDNFETHNFLKLTFDLGWLNRFWQFLCVGLSSFNPKGFCYPYTWSCGLFEGRTSFCTGIISRKPYRLLFMFPTSFTSSCVLLVFPVSITILSWGLAS